MESIDRFNLLKPVVSELKSQGRLELEKNFIQHGTTTVFRHSIRVAYVSILIAQRLKLEVDWHGLVRGALLHDYFLYDWHEKDKTHRLHGFSHARTALRNAREDFQLSALEENLIESHMFPLNHTLPRSREAWIVCVADKYCAVAETMQK